MAWDWQVFCRSTISAEATACFGGAGDITYLQWMLSAWGQTLIVAGLAFCIALLLGVMVGLARSHASAWLRAGGALWVELFRNVPLLVQIFLWYHVLPLAFPGLRQWSGLALATLALGLFTSARIAEQVRAGVAALPTAQRQAARALGLSSLQCYVEVILPQALRIVLPALTSEAMNVIKNSSVAFAVSVTELTLFAMQAQEETARGMEIYAGVTFLYASSALIVNRGFAYAEARLRLPGKLSPA